MLHSVSDWFHHLTQGMAWKSVLSHFQWVDWAAAVFVIVGLVKGIRNGLIGELGGILEISLISFVVFEYEEGLRRFIQGHVRAIPAETAGAVSFFILAMGAWLVVSWISKILKNLFHAEAVPSLRMIGGALFGVIRFVILFSFFSQFLLAFPYEKIKQSYDKGQSYSGETISKLAPKLYEMMSLPYHRMIGKK